MPKRARTDPTGSSGVTWLSRDFGENRATATAATTTRGRLTRIAAPHQNSSSSAPATTGPMAAPAPAKPAHVAMARVRSSGGNTAVMIDSVAGMTNAEPMPMIPRPTMTCPGDVASPAIRRPPPNTPSPPRSAPLRPNRSPRAPADRSNPANTRAYESMIQWSWVAVAPRSCCRRGAATLRDETDMTTRTRDRHMTPRRSQRRRWTSGSSNSWGIAWSTLILRNVSVAQ